MRLAAGLARGAARPHWTLDGDESIRRRPVDRIAEPLRAMGADIEMRDGRLPPFTVRGAELTGIEYELPVASAQVKSCLLIAGMVAAGSTTVSEPAPSRDHTERLCAAPASRSQGRPAAHRVERRRARARRDRRARRSLVRRLHRRGRDARAARVVVRDVGLNWTRTGFYRIAERMGP